MAVKYSGLGDRIKLPTSSPEMTLSQARNNLRATLETGKSTCCPTCGQNAKLYARKFRAPWLRALHALVDTIYLSPGDMVAICGARDYPILANYGLALRRSSDGMWRITALGRDFLEGRATLPSHAVIYNKDVVGFDERKRIHISDLAPDERFSLEELMQTTPVVNEHFTA